MRYAARAYRGPEDLRLIQEHIRDLWRSDGPLAPVHPADVVWWTHRHAKRHVGWKAPIAREAVA